MRHKIAEVSAGKIASGDSRNPTAWPRTFLGRRGWTILLPLLLWDLGKLTGLPISLLYLVDTFDDSFTSTEYTYKWEFLQWSIFPLRKTLLVFFLFLDEKDSYDAFSFSRDMMYAPLALGVFCTHDETKKYLTTLSWEYPSSTGMTLSWTMTFCLQNEKSNQIIAIQQERNENTAYNKNRTEVVAFLGVSF